MRTPSNPIISAALLSLLLLSAFFPDSSAAVQRKRILVLYPYESNMPGFIDLDAGFRKTLAASKDYEFEFYVECMDLTRFPDERYHDRLMELYREKYSITRIDLIVADLRPSLKFLAEYCPESFEKVPVIFCEQDARLLGGQALPSVAAVVTGGLDIEGTVATAMRLHAGARRVYVVTGASRFDQSLEMMTREALRSLETRIEIQYLSRLSMDDLVQRLSDLPENSLVFYVSLFQDGSGKTFKSPDALALLSSRANAPVYSVVEPYMGSGIVGGHILSYSSLGAILARVALRVLAGEKPGMVGPLEESASRYVFDARELRRWEIDENSLPEGSEIRYRTFSAWETYRWRIVVFFSLLIVQALLISALVAGLRKRRRIESALRKAESKYRTVADFTYDWEYWSAPDGRFIYVSPSCKRITGYSARRFVEDPSLFSRIMEPEDRETWEQSVQRCTAKFAPGDTQLRIRTQDGNLRWIEHRCRPVVDEHGRFEGIRGSNREITDRKELQDKLQRAADEWQTTFDSTSDQIMLLDSEFRVVRINTAAASFIGLPLKNALGTECCRLIHGRGTPRPDCPLGRMAETKRHEETILYDAGRDAWLFVSVDPILDEGKELKGVVHTIRNITELKRAQEAMKKSEEFNRSVLASLKNRIVILDRSGAILAVNDAWERFPSPNGSPLPTGLGPGGNYLESCRQSIRTPNDSAGQALNGILSVLDGKSETFSFEYVCDPPFESRWFSMKVVPFRTSGGGVVVSHSDISQRKAAELEAQMRREELTHMSRIVTVGELASSLAHEINQPMTAILCNSLAAQRFLAAAPPDLDEVGKILVDVVQDGRRAGEVIRRLRTLVKKDAPRREPVALGDIIRETVALVQNASLLSKISIMAELDSRIPPVQADRVQLQQVVLNMLMNAIAAMSNTPPALRVLVLKTAMKDGGTAMVSIRDSGSGIGGKDMDRIFEPFFTTKPEGLGMGLSISRTIVKAHGGTVWAENNREGGATFYFTLPVDGEMHS